MAAATVHPVEPFRAGDQIEPVRTDAIVSGVDPLGDWWLSVLSQRLGSLDVVSLGVPGILHSEDRRHASNQRPWRDGTTFLGWSAVGRKAASQHAHPSTTTFDPACFR